MLMLLGQDNVLCLFFFYWRIVLHCTLVHFETYDSLPQYSGIVYMITPQMIRESINELGKMLDDEEITAPILVLFSPPTGERNVENVIRDYNLTDIIEKVRYQLEHAEITLIFLGLSPRQMVASLCSLLRCRPPNLNSAGVWKVSQSYRYHHTHKWLISQRECRFGLAHKEA